ncbi:TetR/AcrR family transcriptional regulator [Streptomyces tendae]|uniref:TetR/AcrR family transcriptional regulator n=1 Tax=Streptomyces tendae TaxID=1932 RepID=UPI003D70D155
MLAATQRLLVAGASFTALGVQHITAEAGVSRSSFYVHFRDKTDLLTRLAARLLAPSFDASSAWRPSDGLDALTETFVRVLRLYREHFAVRRACAEVSAYDPAMSQFWTREIRQFSDWTFEVLRVEQEEGRTPSDVDTLGATQVIINGGEQAIVEHVTTRPPESDRVFARELARIWWYGVYRRPADPSM